MAENKERAPQTTTQPSDGEMSEEEIDRNLTDTFPASDPPSWTLGINHGEEPSGEGRDVAEGGEAEASDVGR
ncbi:MAG TPA: hypothetical protein VF591_08725 [Pyrinomonadaceae bacterium]|jgi:hypothetical protein